MCHNRYEFGVEIFYDKKIYILSPIELSKEQKEPDEVKLYLTVRIILYFNDSIKNMKIICKKFSF